MKISENFQRKYIVFWNVWKIQSLCVCYDKLIVTTNESFGYSFQLGPGSLSNNTVYAIQWVKLHESYGITFYEPRIRTRRKTKISFTKSFKIKEANFEARSSWWSKSNIINSGWSALVAWYWKNGINKRKTIVITVNFRF